MSDRQSMNKDGTSSVGGAQPQAEVPKPVDDDAEDKIREYLIF